MTKALPLNYFKFGIPLLIMLFLALLPGTAMFQQAPEEMSLGILLDLIITVPLLFFLLARKTRIPKIAVIYSFLAGLIVAGFIIPTEHQQLLSRVKFIAIPVIEIGFLGLLIYKISSLNALLKKSKEEDFYDKLLMACKEVFPNRLGKIMATEVAVLYYLFVPSKKKESDELSFTYFKKSGIQSVIGIFLFLVLIETFVVHLVLSKWSVTVAWILSFIGIYTILQILAILRSMDKRLITINHETKCLHLRYGFGCQASIPFSSINSIERYRNSKSKDKSHVCLSLFDLIDSNNLIIYLNEENTLHKIYGIEKKYQSISLFVDESDLFVDSIQQVINEE